jgi:drug/metabolite transporter (DMT)-like permease
LKINSPFAAGSSLRGISCMLLAGIFLTANDAITKWLVPHYPPGQILFTQALVIALLVCVWMRLRGQPLLRVNQWRLHLLRGGLYAAASFAFVYALGLLPLAEVVAIVFAGPLFMTLLAKTLLREQVGPHRLAAVVIGFVGVLIVIRPGTEAMTWAVLLPLAVALLDSIRDIVTRRLTVGESSQRIVLTTAIVLALAGAGTSLQGWQSWRLADIVWFVASASCFVSANFFMIEAYRHAQIVVIAPFKYLQLCWSIIAGLLFWGEVPGLIVIVGIGVIFASGIYIGWREARLGRQSKITVDH